MSSCNMKKKIEVSQLQNTFNQTLNQVNPIYRYDFLKYYKELVDSLESNKLPIFLKDSCYFCKIEYRGYFSNLQTDKLAYQLLDSLPDYYLQILVHHKDSNLLKKKCSATSQCIHNHNNKCSVWMLVKQLERQRQYSDAFNEFLKLSNQANREPIKISSINTRSYYMNTMKDPNGKISSFILLKFNDDGFMHQYILKDTLKKSNIQKCHYKVLRYFYDSMHKNIIIENFEYNSITNSLLHIYQYGIVTKKRIRIIKLTINGININSFKRIRKKYIYDLIMIN